MTYWLQSHTFTHKLPFSHHCSASLAYNSHPQSHAMGPFDAINHLLNFAAPAAFVAALMVLISRLIWKKRQFSDVFIKQFAIVFVVNLIVLIAGLWFFDRDGKMLTYLAMVVASGTVQWVLIKGWQS